MREVAAGLAERGFEVTFFWTYKMASQSEPLLMEARNRQALENAGVKTVWISSRGRNPWSVDRAWKGTNFFSKFAESDFDLVISGRDGTFEYPFTRLRGVRQLEICHYLGAVNIMPGTVAVAHISQWSAYEWTRRGGPKELVRIIDTPVEALTEESGESLRRHLGIQGRIVFGMHQRRDDSLFSEIPLEAYAEIETPDTAFIILNGSPLYGKQANRLGLRSFFQLEPVETSAEISEFLGVLDVYAHGRADGELNSRAIAEAFSLGIPVVTHTVGTACLGQSEQVHEIGFVAATLQDYAAALGALLHSRELRTECGTRSRRAYEQRYEPSAVLDRFALLVEELAASCFPRDSSPWALWRVTIRRLPLVGARQLMRIPGASKTLRRIQIWRAISRAGRKNPDA
jgi:hypothetical protein